MSRNLPKQPSPRAGAVLSRAARTARLEARITADQKRTFGAAAELLGESVSQFVLRAADARARHTLIDDQIIRITDADRRAMVAALSKPPKPAKQLRKAFDRYHARFGG